MPRKELFKPNTDKPFKLSRSKIDIFLECPRCFYLDRRLGISRPSGPPFTLNVAVDTLLKREFDACRKEGRQHPLQSRYRVDAVPARHDKLEEWRKNFTGVQFIHPETNLLVYGAIDDLWISSSGKYYAVDYKATAKAEPVTVLDQPWHETYKRQLEIYQWLLRRNGLDVSDRGFILYCTGRSDRTSFDGRLEFEMMIIPYDGSDYWVNQALQEVKACLESDLIPKKADKCEHCSYVERAAPFLENRD